MLAWYSDTSIPYYMDKDAVALLTYERFDRYAPKKTGNMESHTDYEVVGNDLYFWNDCVYGQYQDEVTAYKGWFSEGVPDTFHRVLEDFAYALKSEDPLPDFIQNIIDSV